MKPPIRFLLLSVIILFIAFSSAQAGTIAALQTDLTALESSQVMALNPYLAVDETSDTRGPLVQLAGVNLHIVNGLGGTNTINGLGNLIIGYGEVNAATYLNRCSDGAYGFQTTCEAAGEIWGYSHKSGSHYLVVGSQNNYSQYGGIAAGFANFVNSGYSSVSGGNLHSASGAYDWRAGTLFETE
jgi:hypothetical protein